MGYRNLFSQQDLTKNYTPLKSQGVLPDIFTDNIRNVIRKDISDLQKNKESDKGIKSDYLTAANYEIERIVKSGNTLINDEVTVFLNKVADVILEKDTALRNKLKIFSLKSFVVNAYSYDKGYTFIDLGLIAQAENEAQLAYTLCHEISHYVKKHNINEYVQNQKTDRNYNGSDEDKLIEKCQYSKEQESEADIEGLKLLERTNYDIKEVEKDFDVLQYSHLPFELVEFKKDFLETKYLKLPERYFLKEASSIRNISYEDDTKHTHPNTLKRKQTIQELLSNRDNTGRVKYIVGQKEFEYIRDLCRMELCRLYLVYRDYPNAFYSAYILSKKYPDNEYLAEVCSKSLYGMTLKSLNKLHYNSDSYLENGLPGYESIESYPQQFYHLYNKMPENEWAIMSLSYIYRAHKKFPGNQQLSSYSDSLIKYMNFIKWGVTDFVRIDKRDSPLKRADTASNIDVSKSKTEMIALIQKENNFRNYDTAYYKEAFLDLFMEDKEFAMKFPAAGLPNEASFSSFSNYYSNRNKKRSKKTRKRDYVTSNRKVEKVILLEPFYYKTNEKRHEELLYVKSDARQEKLINTIHECAGKQKFELVTIDPGILTASDVDKMNDYSVISDWFNEKFDGPEEDRVPILGTNEIEKIFTKYGTHYVLKTGIVSSRYGLRKRTYYYSFIYDLKANETVYRKFEAFRDNDSGDLIKGKLYQTFYELRHSQ